MILSFQSILPLLKQSSKYTLFPGVSSSLLSSTSSIRYFNSNRASITRIHRFKYVRAYPTLLVNPDGSTVNIRYHEPRSIIKLPFDISNLSEDQKKLQLEKRKPRTKVTLEEDSNETNFDSRKYLNILKKK